jgi:mannosyltransferase
LNRLGRGLSVSNRIGIWLLLLLTWLAFGLRVYRLDQRSLWTDEGLSVYRARQDVSRILSGEIVIQGVVSKDTQPPLYFLILHLQRLLAGESGFALKFPSAAFGVLAVPLFYALGRRLLSPAAGLIAALLGATSPLYLWYSQEMRMYPMLVALSALSVYALLQALSAGVGAQSRWWWGAYLLATAGALYTHYTTFFLLVFEVSVALIVAIWQRQRRTLVMMALIGAAGLPLVPYAIWRLRSVYEYNFYFVSLPVIVTSLFGAFATGFTSQLPHLGLIQLALLAPFLIGLVLPGASNKSARWGRAAFLAGWLALPTLALFALSLFKPSFQGPRHLIIVSPAFYLTLASGIAALWRRWKVVGAMTLVGVLAAIVPSWVPFYQGETFLKDDWRGLAAHVVRHARPGDVMLLNDAVLLSVFDFYLPDDLALTALPSYGRSADQKTVAALEEMAEQYQRIWFVPQRPADRRDEDRLVAQWLEANLTPVDEAVYHGLDTIVSVRGYATASPKVESLPGSATRRDLVWGDELLLQGHDIPAEVIPGGMWRPVFYWSKLRQVAGKYVLSFRLLDEGGKVWGHAQADLWGLFPPADWPMDVTIRHEPEIEWPAGLPPGKYQLWLRIVSKRDDQPLPASSGGVDALLVPDVEVRSAVEGQGEARLPPHTARRARFGREIELLGYHVREGHHRPGHLLYLDLYWRVRETPSADYRLRLQMLDAAGQVIGETVTAPTRAEYPPTCWQPEELLSGKAELLIPPQVEGDFYPLRVSLVDPETDKALSVRAGWWPLGRETVALEEVQVVEWPLVTEIPPVQTPLRADFGDPTLIELHGYDLSARQGAAGGNLTLTLIWRARARLETSYTVFVHLADADEQMAGQGDGVPDRGFRLTTSWREGEVLEDSHVIPIRADAPPGSYRLWVGFFDPATGSRLPAFVAGERQPADRVLLDIVQIVP